MTVEYVLGVLNYETVLLFGVLVSIAFAGVDHHKRNNFHLLLFCIGITILQFTIFALFEMDITAKLYPVIVHIPLILLIHYVYKRPFFMSISAVTAAYLCCQSRRWIGSFFLYVFDNTAVWYAIQILVTIPLLYLLIRFVAKPVYRLMQQAKRSQILFGIVPLFYYIFDYSTTVYSDLLYQGAKAAVEFIPSVMSIAYFGFIVMFSVEIQRKAKAEEEQRILAMQVNEATRELSGLRQSQSKAAIYRHDLRHHLRYLESCLRKENTDEALTYIRDIDHSIDESQYIRYCENETVNLILSSYAVSSEKSGIHFSAKADISEKDFQNVSSVDLCVILGNIIENAIQACNKVNGEKYISIETRRQNNRIFWRICNPYSGEVRFDGKLPSTDAIGHGIGLKSVAMIVEKLQGLYEFSAVNNIFTVMLMI